MANVVFAKPAEKDLLDMEHYISMELRNPRAAERMTNGILRTIGQLERYPLRHPLVEDELLEQIGLRMIRFKNYNVFYYYDVQRDCVYIIRILYNRVDWQRLLKR